MGIFDKNFTDIILHPLTEPSFTRKEKKQALAISVALGILTIGITHLVCAIYFAKKKVTPQPQGAENISRTVATIFDHTPKKPPINEPNLGIEKPSPSSPVIDDKSTPENTVAPISDHTPKKPPINEPNSGIEKPSTSSPVIDDKSTPENTVAPISDHTPKKPPINEPNLGIEKPSTSSPVIDDKSTPETAFWKSITPENIDSKLCVNTTYEMFSPVSNRPHFFGINSYRNEGGPHYKVSFRFAEYSYQGSGFSVENGRFKCHRSGTGHTYDYFDNFDDYLRYLCKGDFLHGENFISDFYMLKLADNSEVIYKNPFVK